MMRHNFSLSLLLFSYFTKHFCRTNDYHSEFTVLPWSNATVATCLVNPTKWAIVCASKCFTNESLSSDLPCLRRPTEWIAVLFCANTHRSKIRKLNVHAIFYRCSSSYTWRSCNIISYTASMFYGITFHSFCLWASELWPRLTSLYQRFRLAKGRKK